MHRKQRLLYMTSVN